MTDPARLVEGKVCHHHRSRTRPRPGARAAHSADHGAKILVNDRGRPAMGEAVDARPGPRGGSSHPPTRAARPS